MNNTFNIQRFGLLLKRQWLEFGKIYLVILAVSLSIMITFYGFALWNPLFEGGNFRGRDLNFREPLFLIFGFLFLSVISSSYFAHLGQKPKAIIDLLIPASTFEKFAAGIFFTAICAVASYAVLFYLTDLAFVAALKDMFNGKVDATAFDPETGRQIKSAHNIEYFFSKDSRDSFLPLYFTPFFVSSIFLLGSIYFNRFQYIKTAVSVMIFAGVWTYIIYNFGEWVMKGKVMVDDSGMNNHFSRGDGELYGSLLIVVLTVIFWSITYVRLKEKEV